MIDALRYPDTQLFIAGEWRDSSSGRRIEVVEPATGETIGTVAHVNRADLDAAVAAAATGFRIWSRKSAFERSKIMRKAAEILRSRADYIAWMMTREQGKPLAESRAETLSGADLIDWFAEEARRTHGKIIPARASHIQQSVLRLPVGPVAAFTPWNFPINQIVRKVSAALAAGCSVIAKAPEETPASPAEVIRAFADAGVPAGVLGLVYGVPSEISEYLIPHPIIRKISFTGSTSVGKQLGAMAALHMKRTTMELGGHAPVIVLADADIGNAVSTMVTAKYRNAGQVCVSPTRMLIEAPVFDGFLEQFTEAANQIRVGNGLSEGVRMGPLANERRIAVLEELIRDAVEQGAELTTGGRRTGNSGYFFEPTVLANVPLSARIMNEEPFGPVAIVNRIDDIDAAIAEANRLPYGLASYGFTRSAAAAQRLAVEVEAGMTSINHSGLGLPEVPFGGIKDSGHGSEGGYDAVEPYLVSKFVTHAMK